MQFSEAIQIPTSPRKRMPKHVLDIIVPREIHFSGIPMTKVLSFPFVKNLRLRRPNRLAKVFVALTMIWDKLLWMHLLFCISLQEIFPISVGVVKPPELLQRDRHISLFSLPLQIIVVENPLQMSEINLKRKKCG